MKLQVHYKLTTNEQFVDELAENAGITVEPGERRAFIDKLSDGTMTRAQVLLSIVNNQAFVAKEVKRSLVLLHYFGYLRRNPDDPPDKDLSGFNFWLREVELSGDPGRLPSAFMVSGENKTTTNK